jgi:signal transduction histidine kinase
MGDWVTALFDIRLIGFTAGTLVYLFIVALILGHRRPRLFERLLFFLVLSLFLIYAGGLLEINARIQYGAAPDATKIFYQALVALGALFLLPLIWHTHLEYFRQVRQSPLNFWATVCTALLYLAAFSVLGAAVFLVYRNVDPYRFRVLLAFLNWVARTEFLLGALLCVPLQLVAIRKAKDRVERNMFEWFLASSCLLSILLILQRLTTHSVFGYTIVSPSHHDVLQTAAVIAGVLPGAMLVYYSLRHDFLEFGAQRNLVYALTAMIVALLYFALVRRVSGWLEPVLPPEATASILIFVLIFLFEPLERVIGPALHRTFHERFGRLQQLTGELQETARHGDVARLISVAQERIRAEFGLAAVRISIPRDPSQKALEGPGGLGHAVQMPLMKEGKEIGLLEAASTGSYLTGETSAALEFLAEQLMPMVDLCRLIEEKLRLERELAERERMSQLGQMAASVSHNLRNPLSSMKTVLQVQLENPGLPLDVRRDCALVVEQIDRMSAKLTQLLRYAKPSVNGERVAAVNLAKQMAALFGRDAERRNVRLEFEYPVKEIDVLASEDALSEVLSNLIVNAIEAQPEGGRVRVSLTPNGDRLEVVVEDDGPGISPELRTRIFQPYFTTKATGTGLGLSIVARRVDEMNGTVACESPVRNGKGTRFRLSLPLAAEKGS